MVQEKIFKLISIQDRRQQKPITIPPSPHPSIGLLRNQPQNTKCFQIVSQWSRGATVELMNLNHGLYLMPEAFTPDCGQ